MPVRDSALLEAETTSSDPGPQATSTTLASAQAGVSLKSAAKPDPLTLAEKEKGAVMTPTSACAHTSRTLSDVAVMLSAAKHAGPHETSAASPPLLTNPRAQPSERTRPHTFVHDCAPAGDAARHVDGCSADATVASRPPADSVKFWLTPPLHVHVSTTAGRRGVSWRGARGALVPGSGAPHLDQ